MPARVILEIVSGPIQGKSFVFDRHDTFLFGRHRSCHARLPKDKRVSRHHFLLEVHPPEVQLRDLGSLNGTHVNGVKYGGRAKDESPEEAGRKWCPPVALKHGDRVTAGSTEVLVKVELPLTCCQCGVEISEVERTQWEQAPAQFVCGACRARMANQRQQGTVLEVPRCARCGQDVSNELQEARRGEYLCDDCRARVMAQAGGVHRLLKEEAEKLRGQAGLEIDGYEIGDELGKGGMGAVYEARRRGDGQPVAIKVMLPKAAIDENARKRFLREINVTRELRHPQIVSFFESGAVGSAFYYVMELCNGGSVDGLMKRCGGKVPLAMAVPIMLQCLEGLDHAHRLSFIHRDLKPENVLLTGGGQQWVAKITDFGLAKSLEEAGLSGITLSGMTGGTLAFMPREQLTHFKYLWPASDLWSMAATFYHMATGYYPLDFPPGRDPMEVILYDDPVPIRRRDPSLPQSFASVIDRALVTDPEARYQTAAEMRLALARAIPSPSSS